MTTIIQANGCPSRRESTHQAYVHSVRVALTDGGMNVAGFTSDRSIQRPWLAEVELDAGLEIGTVLVSWHERAGWSLQVRDRSAVYFGVSSAPPPVVLADWVAAVLRHRGFVPTHPGKPFASQDRLSQLRTSDSSEP